MLLNVRHITGLNRSTLCCLCLRLCQHLRALHSGCVIDLGSDYPVILRTPPIRTMSNCQGALVLHSLKPRRVLFAPNWQIGEGKAGRESSRLAWNGSFSDSSQKLLTVVLAMPANTAYENCLLENRVVSLLENLTSSGWPDHLPLCASNESFGFEIFGKVELTRLVWQVHLGIYTIYYRLCGWCLWFSKRTDCTSPLPLVSTPMSAGCGCRRRRVNAFNYMQNIKKYFVKCCREVWHRKLMHLPPQAFRGGRRTSSTFPIYISRRSWVSTTGKW